MFLMLLDTESIVGLKKEESDTLLKFLFDHITHTPDLQLRVRWYKGTVVLFDVRNSKILHHNKLMAD